jgi:hypothetical protein
MNRRIELLITIVVIAVLSSSCLLFYVRILDLQSNIDSEDRLLHDTIQNLTQKTEDLSKPEFYTTQLNWTIVQETSNQFRIDIAGTVFNAGVDTASWVVAEPSFRISENNFLAGVTPQNFTILGLTRTTDGNNMTVTVIDPDFEGRTFRSFSQSFYADNLWVWNITAIELNYQYSANLGTT